MKKVLAAVLVMALSACGSMRPMWVKDGATQSDFNTDKQMCEYEALKAVQSYDPSMRSVFGQSLDMALRRVEVTKACLYTKGYQLRSVAVEPARIVQGIDCSRGAQVGICAL